MLGTGDPISPIGTPNKAYLPYAIATASLLVVGIVSFSIDYRVANWMSDERLRTILRGDAYGIVRLSEAFSHGITVFLLILMIVRLDGRGWKIFPLLLTSSLGAGLLADIGKMLIVRTRPNKQELVGDVINSFGPWLPGHVGHDLQSFPSAHTAVAFGFAVSLCRLYPRGAPLFLLFASLAGLQRIDAGAHYVSDVAIGAAIGVFMAGIAARRLDPAQNRDPITGKAQSALA